MILHGSPCIIILSNVLYFKHFVSPTGVRDNELRQSREYIIIFSKVVYFKHFVSPTGVRNNERRLFREYIFIFSNVLYFQHFVSPTGVRDNERQLYIIINIQIYFSLIFTLLQFFIIWFRSQIKE